MKKLLVILLVLLLAAVAIAATSILLSGRPGTALAGSKILTVQLSEPLLDYQAIARLPFLDHLPRQSLASIHRALRAAREDRRVLGLAIYLRNARFGLAKAEELRALFRSVSDSGKFVECYLETAGEGSNGTLVYFLASACDRIWLAPAGELNLVGLYLDSTFLKGALDKLEIEPEFDNVGEYKSASEAYTRSDHSESSEEALAAILDSLYSQIVTAIATERGIAPDRVKAIIDGAPHSADAAVELGLVDEIAYPDRFKEALLEGTEGDPLFVSTEEYAAAGRSRSPLAIVFAQGSIHRGEGGVDPWTREIHLGSNDLGRILADLEEESSVRAVVLRIDSPGGSALASDLILRRVERLASAKPVVVSMSDTAASGGYYIAAKATRIVASAATITGSIGVVGGKLVTRDFQSELLGITHDTLQRGANANYFSTLDPFTDDQAALFRSQMLRVYDLFLKHVAEGRGMSREMVSAVAGGRVWTGAAALERGLVDELGGLDRAVDLALELAELSPQEVRAFRYLPQPPSLLDLLTDGRQPPLYSPLDLLERELRPPPPQLLELPPELTALSRPF